MFKDIKKGDRVWSIRKGWGTVLNINIGSTFPIVVRFDCMVSASYTKDGKINSEDLFPAIFWGEFKVPEEVLKRPLPKLEVDTKVLVWDNDDKDKKKRHFSHFDKFGRVHCFTEGRSSWSGCTTNFWNNWELYKEPLDDKEDTLK